MFQPASSSADWDPRSPERRRLVQQVVDHSLVESVARGERAAIDSLVHRFAGRVRGFYLARGVGPAESLQLTRRTLGQAVNAAGAFDGLTGIQVWLRRFAAQGLAQWAGQTTAAVGRHRARYRRQVADLRGTLPTDWTELCLEVDRIGFVTPHAEVDPHQLHRLLHELPRPQREVLLAYYGRLESIELISQRVRRGEVAVRRLLDQGLNQLWQQTRAAEAPSTADGVPPLRHNHPAFSGFDPATLKLGRSKEPVWDFRHLPPEEWAGFADWLALEEVLYQVCAPAQLHTADVVGNRLVEPLRRTVWPWRAALVLVPLLAMTLFLKEWPTGGMVPVWFDTPDSAPDPRLATAPGPPAQDTNVRNRAGQDTDGQDADGQDTDGQDIDEQLPDAAGESGGSAESGGSGRRDASWPHPTGLTEGGAEVERRTPAAAAEEPSSARSTGGPGSQAGPGALVELRPSSASGQSSGTGQLYGSTEPGSPPLSPDSPAPPGQPVPSVPPSPPPGRSVDDLAAWRAELYRLVYDRDWVALKQWCSQLEFTGSAAERQWGKNLSRWGATVAQVEGNPESLAMSDASWSLLGRTYDRRTYEAIQEYYASLEAEAVADFEKLHRRLTAQQYPGLAPWPGDAEQLVTVWGASQLARHWLAREQKTSAEDRAAARIHVARILRGATVEQAWELARLYEGTAAAGRVYEWLGQQELQALRLADAQGLIRRAASVDPAHAERWQAWLNQLSRATLTTSAANSAVIATAENATAENVPSDPGGQRLPNFTPEELANGANAAAASSWAPVWQTDWGPPEVFPADWLTVSPTEKLAAPDVPPPAVHITAQEKMPVAPWQPESSLALPLRRHETAHATEPVIMARRAIVWPEGRQAMGVAGPATAADPTGSAQPGDPSGTQSSVMVWQTAEELCAWDSQTQRPLWHYTAPEQPSRASERSPNVGGFRPVVDAERVVSTLGRQCYCHDLETGDVLWRTDLPLGMTLVSSPVIRADRYAAVATVKTPQGTEVRLLHLDPFSGVVLAEFPLFLMRTVWRPLERCELAESGEMLVGVWRGLSSGFDIYGHVYWVREAIAVPPQLDPGISQLDLQSPLLSEQFAWIWQPGVPTVECVELRSGRRVWRKVWTDLQRFIGSAPDTLVFARNQEMIALSQTTGEVKWRKPLRTAWGPVGWSDVAGRAWVWTQNRDAQTGATTWLAHWLDLATGKFLGSWQLRFPAESPVTLGPLVAHQGRFWLLTARRDVQTWELWPLSIRRNQGPVPGNPVSQRAAPAPPHGTGSLVLVRERDLGPTWWAQPARSRFVAAELTSDEDGP